MALAWANQNNVQMCLCVDGCTPKFNSAKLAAFSEKIRFTVWKQDESLSFAFLLLAKKRSVWFLFAVFVVLYLYLFLFCDYASIA